MDDAVWIDQLSCGLAWRFQVSLILGIPRVKDMVTWGVWLMDPLSLRNCCPFLRSLVWLRLSTFCQQTPFRRELCRCSTWEQMPTCALAMATVTPRGGAVVECWCDWVCKRCNSWGFFEPTEMKKASYFYPSFSVFQHQTRISVGWAWKWGTLIPP